MARVRQMLVVETSAVCDAVTELNTLIEALRHRHGDHFRALERLIEGSLADLTVPAVHYLGDGILVAEAPPEIPVLLREGRKLGVI